MNSSSRDRYDLRALCFISNNRSLKQIYYLAQDGLITVLSGGMINIIIKHSTVRYLLVLVNLLTRAAQCCINYV